MLKRPFEKRRCSKSFFKLGVFNNDPGPVQMRLADFTLVFTPYNFFVNFADHSERYDAERSHYTNPFPRGTFLKPESDFMELNLPQMVLRFKKSFLNFKRRISSVIKGTYGLSFQILLCFLKDFLFIKKIDQNWFYKKKPSFHCVRNYFLPF